MRSNAVLFIFVAIAVCLSAPLTAGEDDPTLRCFRIGVPAGVGATHVFMDLTTRVFSSAHLCVTALRLPQIRLTGMIESDELDGAVLPGPIDAQLRSLLEPVATPLTHFTGMLFWPADKPEPRGTSSTLGIVLGQEWAHDEVARRGTDIIEVRDNKQLFEMTENGRLHGFLLPKETIRHFLPDYPVLATYQSREIADLPVTLLILPRHKNIMPGIDRTIRALQKDGIMDKMISDYAP